MSRHPVAVASPVAVEPFWAQCGCLAGLGHIPSVSDCHQAGLCRMREDDRARDAAATRDAALRVQITAVMDRCNQARADAAASASPNEACAYDNAAEWIRRALDGAT